ncbi:ABC transporter ATP-binding protein [Acetobacter tropicalis]|uniref:ABC transporter ATP-binding protein n=1 Tax=Acetobacter tropicalis TaxID=104102 RepID=UPI0039756C21
MTELLAVQNVSFSRSGGKGNMRSILKGLSFDVKPGETVAILGQSGTGKTTLAHILAGLVPPTSGSVRYKGVETQHLAHRQNRSLRPDLQMIFQDPYSSLDPRQTVSAVMDEPLWARALDNGQKQKRVSEMLHALALPPESLARRAHEFSGGQRQRIAIARALVGYPSLVIADEAVSALDASARARVLNVLLEQQQKTGLSLVFISHDMAVVQHMAHRVIVLADGAIVEEGPTGQIFANPGSAHTAALIQKDLWKDTNV